MKRHSQLLSVVLILSLLAVLLPARNVVAQTTKTHVVDHLVDASGTPLSGKVTFLLTQKAASGPDGLVIASPSVSATLDGTGLFSVYLYPSASLSPVSYYQVYVTTGAGNQTLLGIYNIPASSGIVTLAPYKVTDTNLAAQYTFADMPSVLALTQTISSAVFASLTSANVTSALGYTPANAATLGSMASQQAASVNVTGGTLSNVTCTNCTNVGSATSGAFAATGDEVINYDSDANGSGVFRLQRGGVDKLVLNNDGTTDLTGGLASFTRAGRPAPGHPGRLIRQTDAERGLWVDTGTSWVAINNELHVAWFGAVPDDGVDDTAAIQAAINAAAALKVARVRFADGLYLVNGALQTTATGAQARILWPRIGAGTGQEGVALELVGVAPPIPGYSVIGFIEMPTRGSIIKSSATGGGAIFGGDGDITAARVTNVLVTMRDMTIRTVDNPQQTAVDAGYLSLFRIENVVIDTGTTTVSQSLPTTTTAYGLVTPNNGNGADTVVRNVWVTGYRVGVVVQEHAVLENVNIVSCRTAFRYTYAAHTSLITRADYQACPYGFEFVGGEHVLHALAVNSEHESVASIGLPTWTYHVADLVDPSGYAKGMMNWAGHEGYGSPVVEPTIQGLGGATGPNSIAMVVNTLRKPLRARFGDVTFGARSLAASGILRAHFATNVNLEMFQNPVGEAVFSAANDAGTAAIPLNFYGSKFTFNVSAGGAGMQLDTAGGAGQTQLLLYDITAGTLKRVSVSAADSCGTGFKCLRIPN